MGFRVVDRSSFTFTYETDLPPSARNIHPSGILHAFRLSNPSKDAASSEGGDTGLGDHAFAWIVNSLHIDSAINYFVKQGYDKSTGIVFIPYSTRKNWLERYPHAQLTFGGMDDGESAFVSKSGDAHFFVEHADACGDMDHVDAGDGADLGTDSSGDKAKRNPKLVDNDGESIFRTGMGYDKSKKKKPMGRQANMLGDSAYINDAERDELHIEIYKYLSWLHGKLVEFERGREGQAGAELGETLAVPALDSDGNEVDEGGNKEKASRKAVNKKYRSKSKRGVVVSELRGVLDKLESTFAVVAISKMEEEARAGESPTQQQTEGPNDPAAKKGAPFLEEALSDALSQLVSARQLAGKPLRRNRKRPRPPTAGQKGPIPLGFEEMFGRLVRYKARHGNCQVTRNYEDKKLGNWVNAMRNERRRLVKLGLEHEENPTKILAKTLTAERREKLDSVGFVWVVAPPKVSWEERFRDCVEYYDVNGRWPAHSAGQLGEWVHKQRVAYRTGDANFMKNKAPKLDEIGFEWAPRGARSSYSGMDWDEGFEMLMEFGRENGHYDVPCPSDEAGRSEAYVNLPWRKSDQVQLYKYVKNLHGMYKLYKLGQHSGMLTDERVVMLVKSGFSFRND